METIGGVTKHTILVVEDTASVRHLVSQMLHQSGYDVVEAADGVSALQILNSRTQPVDLVLTDIVMPRMGGAELAVHLFNMRPLTRVLFMSGYMEDPTVRALEAYPAALLYKPFTAGALLGKVREILEKPWLGVPRMTADAS